ncbi:MAG: nucleotidyltransferase family protein, partial [Clostridia bacterium]|nr:nucleotidyltransferase family protein [Clostridia bacterium]
IDFMPLKGAVIRQYYPEPWMRTSCDIDIHVKKDRLE